MSSSPHLQSSNSVVFLDSPRAPELRRSPRLPRRRKRHGGGRDNDGDNDDSGDDVFVLRFSPSPAPRKEFPDDDGEESDDVSLSLQKAGRRRHRAMAALRSVEERIHANSEISARSVKEHLNEQKQRLGRFKSKFLRKLNTSPFPAATSLSPETNCPLQDSVKPGHWQDNLTHVAVEKEITVSIRTRCLHKRPALDSVWLPVALIGLCFGFSAAVLLLLCWFYSYPVITQVLALHDSKSGNNHTDIPSQIE